MRKLGNNTFPQHADPALILRRRLAALHTRLREATEAEHYEEAAKLRDDIAAVEKGVYSHEF